MTEKLKYPQYIQYLPLNEEGRDFVMGDIHGCFDLVEKAMEKAGFDKTRDRLICVGDTINRGPYSLACLEFIGQPWFFAVRGNHEQYFIDAYEQGGMTFPRDKITQDNEWLSPLPHHIIDLLYQKFKSLPVIIEAQTSKGKTGIVHADIPKKQSWQTFKNKITAGKKKAFNAAVTGRMRITDGVTKKVAGVERVFLGHTPLKEGPVQLGNCFFIDCGAVYRASGKEHTLILAEMTLDDAAYHAPGKHKKSVTIIKSVKPS